MRLFIAEKPSVAKAIVAELGCVTRGDGFITCKDGSVVTWCFGHLLGGTGRVFAGRRPAYEKRIQSLAF